VVKIYKVLKYAIKYVDIGLLKRMIAVTALVENGGLWQWIVADNRRQFQTISDSIMVLANCRRLRLRDAKII